MAVSVKRPQENQIRVCIGVGGPGGRPRVDLNLDMSLQRHCYRNLADAAAKDQNSVMHDIVSDAEIMADAKRLGVRLEEALRDVEPEKIGLGRDFKLVTRRVYRVDATTPRLANPNHFFPVSGPGVWSGIDKATFAAISHFRDLEILLLAKFGDALARENLHAFYLEMKRVKKLVAGRAEGLNMADKRKVDANIRMKDLIDRMDNVNLNTGFNQLSDATRSRIVDCAGNKPWHQTILRFLSDFASSRAWAT